MVSSSAAFLPGRVGLLSLSLAVTGPLYFLSRLAAAVLRVEPRAFGRFREAFYWPRPQLRSQRPHSALTIFLLQPHQVVGLEHPVLGKPGLG